MNIRRLFLTGMLLGLPSLAYLQAHGAGAKSPAPAAWASAAYDSDEDNATCFGGSVASRVYETLKIAGACTIDAGSVKVEHDLTVLPGGSLVAVVGGSFTMPVGSDLKVGGDLEVESNGILVLGCEPIHFICSNDPDQKVGSFVTKHTIGGRLKAEDALAVVVHLTVIGHDASLKGGGGGVSCSTVLPALGAPPYGDFEDNVIEGGLTIKGWQSCWLGVFRNTINHSVDYDGNVTADPDGNEVTNNAIVHDLSCVGNSPSPQIGDSGGGPNTVFGHASGQCATAALVR
ncbi:MAG: hypothetical protein JOY54_09240 [Acidobacteriaceae bacterium]|nr:hypothetical protein [Acidobacteriaceae bacterium]